jgi:hypothetical protein
MNRNWHRHAKCGLPILSAALLSAAGLLCHDAFAQSAPNGVIVDYDVLNGLPGAAAQPAPQAAPSYAPAPVPYGGAMPPYAPYVMVRPGIYAPMVPGYAPALAAPPSGTPTSAITTLGPNGRPTVPIQLKRPGSSDQQYGEATDGQVASVTPPEEPGQVPTEVPMLEPTPPAPPPAAEIEAAPETPTVETPAPPAEPEVAAVEPSAPEPPAEQPAPEEPSAQQEPAEQPAQEEPAQQQAAQEPESAPADAASGETPPAEGEAAEEEQPTEEAAAEAPPEPDNTQPAAPIPQGGIRIVFPTEFNDVPAEANSALDDLAAQMLADESMRIEIKCYASGTTDTESKARRKSLQRCINIRQYLFRKDVRTTRMDVRALGLKSEGQPADRVDIVPANS